MVRGRPKRQQLHGDEVVKGVGGRGGNPVIKFRPKDLAAELHALQEARRQEEETGQPQQTEEGGDSSGGESKE